MIKCLAPQYSMSALDGLSYISGLDLRSVHRFWLLVLLAQAVKNVPDSYVQWTNFGHTEVNERD